MKNSIFALKGYLLYFAFFCCFAQNLHSQTADDYCWQLQTSGMTNRLIDVYFVNDKTGWTVGAFGAIVHTSDGGAIWQDQTPGTTNTLRGVHFTDSLRGWAVGDNGWIIYTANGGVTWQKQIPGVSLGLNDIYFANNNKGWAVGFGGTILHTTDGGATWQTQASGTTNTLWGVHFIDNLTGWAVGTNGRIIRTVDGGVTWQVQTSGTTAWFRGAHFTDSLTGWTVGSSGSSGTIVHSTDGGTTWQSQTYEETLWLYDVYFTGITTGWIVGSGGTILHTTDSGTTWQTQISGTTEALEGVYFTDSLTGWAVGGSGTILKYSAIPIPIAEFTWSLQDAAVQFSNTSIDATSFFWNFGDGQTSEEKNPIHAYTHIGTYNVTLTVTNACGSTSTSGQSINVTVGVSMPEFLDVFDIHPNPAGEYFTLRLSGEPRAELVVELISSAGQSVFNETFDFQSGSALQNISCRNIPAGIYLVRVSDLRRSVFQKIVLE